MVLYPRLEDFEFRFVLRTISAVQSRLFLLFFFLLGSQFLAINDCDDLPFDIFGYLSHVINDTVDNIVGMYGQFSHLLVYLLISLFKEGTIVEQIPDLMH